MSESGKQSRWDRIAEQIGRRYAEKNIGDWVYHGTGSERERQLAVITGVKRFTDSLADQCDSGVNLLFCGSKGTGKDFLMSTTLKAAVLRDGRFAKWLNGTAFFVQYRDSMRSDAETPEAQLIDSLTTFGILAISDPLPPVGPLTEFQATTLLTVIDARYRAGRPTWMTLNVSTSAELATRMGSQLADRLLHRSEVFTCQWPSYREYERKAGN